MQGHPAGLLILVQFSCPGLTGAHGARIQPLHGVHL